MYEEYFQSLLNIGRAGWYEPNEERVELDWSKKRVP